MFEVATGQVINNDDAPTRDKLAEWLEQHPGWQAVPKATEEKTQPLSEESEVMCLEILSCYCISSFVL